jgi:ABC-type nickel/cobalt efflux system permease component RcnA
MLVAVEELMQLEDDTVALSRFYWWATVAGLTAGLLLTTLAAILAALNTAVTPASALSGVPGLYLFNFLASECFFSSAVFLLLIFFYL